MRATVAVVALVQPPARSRAFARALLALFVVVFVLYMWMVIADLGWLGVLVGVLVLAVVALLLGIALDVLG